MDYNKLNAGTPWVPAPVSQMGGYELDLLKFGYYGWMNAVTIATELWLQHLTAAVPEIE